jgi:hypothetical protein
VLHVPAPLHVRAGVNELAAHVASTQTVPAPYLRQAPEPSHVPSVPHDGASWSVHWLSGSVPAGTTLQVPKLPASAHDWHVPVQAVAQQMSWLQFPDAQSMAAAHAAPLDFLPQTLALHVFGLRHSGFVVHELRQAPLVPQTYGVQVDCVPGWQTPEPLHCGADVNVEPAQVVAPQLVPPA